MIAPGIGITLYAGKGPARALAESRAILTELRPSIINLHTAPDDTDAPLIVEARKLCPDARLWMSPGINGLADDTIEQCRAAGERHGKWCKAHGVPLLMPNAEAGAPILDANGKRKIGPGSEKLRGPGWVIYESEMPGATATLRKAEANRRRDILRPKLFAYYEGAKSTGVEVAITSHDWPDTHPLTGGLTHEALALLLPQVYPAHSTKEENFVTQAEAAGRLAATLKHYAAYPHVRLDLRPGTSGWAIYGQLWGHRAAAVAWLSDQSDVYLGWGAPLYPVGRAQAAGLMGLRLSLEARRRYGEGKGAIKRAQAALGLVVDGLPGPKTAAAMGLPWG